MKVIIAGVSKVGFALAKQIVKEGFDLVVIDKDQEAIEIVTDSFDCNGIVGNASSPALLKKAGIEDARLFVAVTKDDETNLLCCGIAKQMGVRCTIAAVRGPEYSEDKAFFHDKMGVDRFINPFQAAAAEGIKMIRYAESVEREQFGSGNLQVASVAIKEGSVLAGVKMPDIQAAIGAHILVCAIERGDKVFTPKGQADIRVGDKITFAAKSADMEKALIALDIMEKILKKAVVIGGGRIGYYIIDKLLEQGIKVTLIDRDPDRCRRILEQYPDINVLNGVGTDASLMERELKDADACLACTGSDEENLIVSMYAKSYGMDRVAAVIDDISYGSMLKRSGINHIFSTQEVALTGIIREARVLAMDNDTQDSDAMKWLYKINGGRVEAMQFKAGSMFACLDVPFKDKRFRLKPGVLIVAILRDGGVIVPDGDSCISDGDEVIVVCAEQKIMKLSDILAGTAKES